MIRDKPLLQRSGTNLIKYLLESNFAVDVVVNHGAWKHGMCDAYHQRSPVILITKDIYSWLDSAFRFWVMPKLSDCDEEAIREEFSRFLRNQFRFEHANSPDACSHWNLMNRHWMDLEIEPWGVHHIRYEDLLTPESAEAACERVGEGLNLQRTSAQFVLPALKMGMGCERTGVTKRPFDAGYYRSRSFLNRYTRDDIEWVESRVDPALRLRLGYQAPHSEHVTS